MEEISAEFERAVERYRAVVLATALRETGNFALAEDATQDTFIALHEKFEQLEDRDRLAPWLMETARRISRALLRKTSRHEPTENLPHKEAPSVPPPLLNAESSAEALSILQAVPDDDRELLVASLLEGRSHDQIAASLEISGVALRKRLERARERLRAAGRSFDSLAKLLGMAAFPANYAERCRLSSEARRAAGIEVFRERDVSRGMYSVDALEAAQRGLQSARRALALDPYNAVNHASVASILIMSERNKFKRAELAAGREVQSGDWIGKLRGPDMRMAAEHVRAATALDPADPSVCLVSAMLMVEQSDDSASIPYESVRSTISAGLDVAPERVDLAAALVSVAIFSGEEPDFAALRTALTAFGDQYGHGVVAAMANLLAIAVARKRYAAAKQVLEIVEALHVLDGAREAHARCVAHYRELLASR